MQVSFRKIAPGDRIHVVAPSSPVRDGAALKRGVAILARRYRVSVPRGVYARKGFLAGADTTRLGCIQKALSDGRTRAIFTARGGHGATRLLARVDWERWYEDRKPMVGFSDVTALQLASLALAGVSSIHGPSVSSISTQPKGYQRHLMRLLEDPGYDFGQPPARLRSLKQGRVVGPLVGGNLSMIDQLVGTPFLPDLAGCILLVEDVNEPPYRIDRMMTHLGNAGCLDRLAGLVVGQFTRCRPRVDGVTVQEVFAEHVSRLSIPALRGMPTGHGRRNWAFVQGARVELKCGYRDEKATLRPI